MYYFQLEKKIEEISRLENILSLLNWDVACNMKIKSESSRTQEMMSLNNLIRNLWLSDETKHLLEQANKEIKVLNQFQKANLKEINTIIKNEEIIPQDLKNHFLAATIKANLVWRSAKKQNNYNLFKPYLQKVLDITKEMAWLRSQALHLPLYDALIVKFNPDSQSDEIKKNFNILKNKLPSIIQAILKKQKPQQHLFKTIPMALNKQKKLNEKIIAVLGFDLKYGRLDESTHPFCGGTPFDVRLTTNYQKENFFCSFAATIHETGHGLYEQNLPAQYKNQPVGKARGGQFHESQSLLIEKQVGRSKEFLNFLSTFIKETLHLEDNVFSSHNLYLQTNEVKPSFIRVYSDEVTYPLHVILRFEIEELLINDQLSLDDLPSVWNQKMQDYLGVTPPTFTQGCLQDIHWANGSFGSFPSYANGAIISAMVMNYIYSLFPDIQKDFAKGNFQRFNNYLNHNFRNHGSLYSSQDLLLKNTGEKKINPYVFLTYLEKKYLSNE